MTKVKRAVLVILVVSIACLVSIAAQSTPRKDGYTLTSKSTRRSLTTAGRTTTHRPSSNTFYYYMDNSAQCTNYGITDYFYTSQDTAYIKAWSSSFQHHPIVGTCSMTIFTYASYGSKYRFPSYYSNSIRDCSVTLNIYSGISTSGTALKSYSCFDSLPTTAQHISSGYITIELVNYGGSSNYDFTMFVENYDYLSGGDIAGIVIGSSVFMTIIFVALCLVRRRRRRMYTRGPVLIATSTSTANYNYPTGAAPYSTNNYGSVSASTNYPPPSYGPPPPSYGPAPPSYPGPPQPASSANYQQPPPPPNYS